MAHEALDQIARQAMPAPVPAADSGPDMGLQARLDLLLQLGGRLLDAHEQERARQARLSQAVRFFDFATVAYTVSSGALVTAVLELPGPMDGYTWAVQRINVIGIGSADTIGLYKCLAQGSSAVQQQVGPDFTATSPFYHPGKTGLLMKAKENLALQGIGNLTGTSTVFLAGTVINLPVSRTGDLLI